MITPLSYYKINKKTPTIELFDYFIQSNENNKLSFESLLKNKPVYSIHQDKQEGTYYGELYFYRYTPDRDSVQVILDDDIPYDVLKCIPMFDKIIFPEDYLITSIEITQNGNELNESICFYRDGPTDGYPYEYFYRTECINNILKNITGIDYAILPFEPNHNLFIQRYKKNINTHAFIAKKLKTNTYGYYFEKVEFEVFMTFIKDMDYPSDFIEFCITNYNGDYYFSFSYDIDKEGYCIKSKIFGVYNR